MNDTIKRTMAQQTNSRLEGLEKLQRTDHDIIVRLETKFDSMHDDIREMKDGTSTKLAEHEKRIRTLEKINEEIKPSIVIEKLEEVYQWKHDFKLTWKVTLGVATGLGSIITFILTILSMSLGIIHFDR